MKQKAEFRKLRDIATAAIESPLDDFIGHYGTSWDFGSSCLTLVDRTYDDYLGVIEALRAVDNWGDLCSVQYLMDSLANVLWELRAENDNRANELFLSLLTNLDQYSLEQHTYIPVLGLDLLLPQFTIGSIVFKEVSQDDPVLHARDSSAYQSGDQQAEAESPQNNQDKKLLIGKISGVFVCASEPIRARERAEAEITRALEVITFLNCAMYPYHPQGDSVAGLQGTQASGQSIAVVLSSERRIWTINNNPSRFPITITDGTVRHWRTLGLSGLSEILEKDHGSLSMIERMILRAIHWIFVSQSQLDPSTQLVNLATSIEALLGPPNKQAITKSVSENLAIILESDYGRRVEIMRAFSKLYGLRSDAAHGTQEKEVHNYHVRQLRYFATSLIVALLRHRNEIRTREDLLDWLSRSKLSGQLATAGSRRSLRELRESLSWTQVDLANTLGVDPNLLNLWEKSEPSFESLRKCANALGVQVDKIKLLPTSKLVNVENHIFILKAVRNGTHWTAKIRSWDHTEATLWPCRPIDQDDPESESPSYIMHTWTSSGESAEDALSQLAERLSSAMIRALKREPVAGDPSGWSPPEIPEHWKRHLEAREKKTH